MEPKSPSSSSSSSSSPLINSLRQVAFDAANVGEPCVEHGALLLITLCGLPRARKLAYAAIFGDLMRIVLLEEKGEDGR